MDPTVPYRPHPYHAPPRDVPRHVDRTAPEPAFPAPPPAQGGGICALGRAYGGWAPDSDAARICHIAYGN